MWEDCYHIGGADDGVIDAGGITVGTALCLEYDRWPTVRRFQGRGDVVIGGSFIWGMPDLVTDDTTLQAFGNAVDWTPRFARLMGVPAVEAGVTGRLRCPMPGFPDGLRDDGPPGRSATIVDADGSVLAERHRDQGKGFAIADIEPRRPVPQQPPANPDAFWIARSTPSPPAAGSSKQNWAASATPTDGARLRAGG